LIHNLRGALATWRSNRGWKVASTALALVAVGLSTYYLASKLGDSLRHAATLDWRIVAGPLALSTAITFVCVLLGSLDWHLTMKSVRAGLSWRACASSYLLATLGGYLPGYAWRHLGIAYLTKRQGISVKNASLAVLIEFVAIVAVRAALALSTMPSSLLARWGLDVPLLYPRALAALLWLALLLAPLALEQLARRARQRHTTWADLRFHRTSLWLAMLVISVSHVLYGWGFAILANAVSGVGPLPLGAAVFSTSASWLVTLAMFFVPAGLSVREGAITLGLSGVLPEGIAALAAVLSRGVLILAEGIGALIGWWMRPRAS
jgi:uncharacterized membrane protein YbhN (UPF0104 family)